MQLMLVLLVAVALKFLGRRVLVFDAEGDLLPRRKADLRGVEAMVFYGDGDLVAGVRDRDDAAKSDGNEQD